MFCQTNTSKRPPLRDLLTYFLDYFRRSNARATHLLFRLGRLRDCLNIRHVQPPTQKKPPTRDGIKKCAEAQPREKLLHFVCIVNTHTISCTKAPISLDRTVSAPSAGDNASSQQSDATPALDAAWLHYAQPPTPTGRHQAQASLSARSPCPRRQPQPPTQAQAAHPPRHTHKPNSYPPAPPASILERADHKPEASSSPPPPHP